MSDNESCDSSRVFTSQSSARSSPYESRSPSRESGQGREVPAQDSSANRQRIDEIQVVPDRRPSNIMTRLPNTEYFGFDEEDHPKVPNRWDRFHSCHLDDLYKDNDHSHGLYQGGYYRGLPWINQEDEDLHREISDSKKAHFYDSAGNEASPAPANGEPPDLRRRPISIVIKQPPPPVAVAPTHKEQAHEEDSTKDKLELGKEADQPSMQSDSEGFHKHRVIGPDRQQQFMATPKSGKVGRPRVMSEMIRSLKKPPLKPMKYSLFRKMKFNSDIKQNKRKLVCRTVFSDDPLKGSFP